MTSWAKFELSLEMAEESGWEDEQISSNKITAQSNNMAVRFLECSGKIRKMNAGRHFAGVRT